MNKVRLVNAHVQVAIIMDPPTKDCFARVTYSVASQTGRFGGREWEHYN